MSILKERVVGKGNFLPCGVWIILLNCILFSCASTPNLQSGPGLNSEPRQPTAFRPASSSEIAETYPVKGGGGLPLGITGSFDLFVSEAAGSLADVYNDVLKPLQKGKIFKRQPYELDYAILPERGDVFNHTGRLDSLNFRSDYEFRIGMVRRFQDWTDFLNPGFWLAQGEYDPVVSFSRPSPSPWLDGCDSSSLNLEKQWNLDWDMITGMGEIQDNNN